MDNQIIWNVYNLVRTMPEGVVTMVNCRVSMIDGEHKALGNINQDVPYKSPSDPGFIPFDQLTETETVQWVKDQLGPEKIAQLQRALQNTLNQQKVTTVQGTTW
jgi:hypothetical protein